MYSNQPKTRWKQFTLRTVIFVVTATAVFFAWRRDRSELTGRIEQLKSKQQQLQAENAKLKEDAVKSRQQIDRLLYTRNIQLAQQAWQSANAGSRDLLKDMSEETKHLQDEATQKALSNTKD